MVVDGHKSIDKYYRLTFYRRIFARQNSVGKTKLPTDIVLYGRNMTVGNQCYFCSDISFLNLKY